MEASLAPNTPARKAQAKSPDRAGKSGEEPGTRTSRRAGGLVQSQPALPAGPMSQPDLPRPALLPLSNEDGVTVARATCSPAACLQSCFVRSSKNPKPGEAFNSRGGFCLFLKRRRLLPLAKILRGVETPKPWQPQGCRNLGGWWMGRGFSYFWGWRWGADSDLGQETCCGRKEKLITRARVLCPAAHPPPTPPHPGPLQNINLSGPLHPILRATF